MRTSSHKNNAWTILILSGFLLLNACGQGSITTAALTPLPSPATRSPTQPSGLSEDQFSSLASLEKVDDFPLYSMHYYAEYDLSQSTFQDTSHPPEFSNLPGSYQDIKPAWGCSLFAAFGDPEHPLFGRNFDWDYSPAMILFTHPKVGNASVSLVDLTYLVGEQATKLLELPVEQRVSLLEAPAWPFDGMNDCGLAIGMAAVPSTNALQNDPQKTDIDSLGIMRLILDQACSIDEAIDLIDNYNILWGSGPELHYLIADASGRAVLLEYYEGAMQVIPNHNSWHQATNFLLSSAGDPPTGVCSRYDTISATMQDNSGKLTSKQAITSLFQVSQDSTQWSAVYDLKSGEIKIVVGGDYPHPHTFQLDMEP